MKKKEEPYGELLEQHLTGSINRPDKEALMHAVASGKADRALDATFYKEWQKLSGPQNTEHNLNGDAIFQGIQRQINHQLDEDALPIKKFFISNMAKWAIAASLIGLIATTVIWNFYFSAPDSLFAASIPKTYLKTTNTSTAINSFALPDGSIVDMVSGSTLHYPQAFNGNMREVYLEGDAFFEIRKQDGKGFKVYSRSLVAEVLGTSFWVRENIKDGSDNIEVRTGKVRVSAFPQKGKQTSQNEPMVVMPNQKVQFSKTDGILNLTLADSLIPVDNHNLVETNTRVSELNFRKPTKLKIILFELEELYGVNIEVANPNLYNCLMAGNLSTQELFKKLDIICLSIGAAYKIEGTKIILSGDGCPDL